MDPPRSRSRAKSRGKACRYVRRQVQTLTFPEDSSSSTLGIRVLVGRYLIVLANTENASILHPANCEKTPPAKEAGATSTAVHTLRAKTHATTGMRSTVPGTLSTRILNPDT